MGDYGAELEVNVTLATLSNVKTHRGVDAAEVAVELTQHHVRGPHRSDSGLQVIVGERLVLDVQHIAGSTPKPLQSHGGECLVHEHP